MLQRLIEHNDRIPLSPYAVGSLLSSIVALTTRFSSEALTRFHSRAAPNISVLDYLRRIVQYTKAEVSRFSGSLACLLMPPLRLPPNPGTRQRWCLLITLHYIDQICERNPRFTITSLTCHRFVITSISIASKTFCDSFCRNSVYAKVGGISTAELNVLEREFLSMIEWRLTVSLRS